MCLDVSGPQLARLTHSIGQFSHAGSHLPCVELASTMCCMLSASVNLEVYNVGLFGSRQSAAVDPALASLVIAGTDKGREWGLKVLAKNQDGIRSSLAPSESALILTPYLGGFGGDMLFVITDQRSIEFKNGQIKRVLRHDEVAETSLGTMPNGNTMVKIESEASRMDFRQNDPERFSKIIMVEVATPRVGNTICAAIDQFL